MYPAPFSGSPSFQGIFLLKMVDMPLYGREVMIRVPDENNLLLGEKVVIAEKSKMPKILKNSAIQGGQE